MYLRTKGGLGWDLEPRLAPPPFNQVMAEPIPIGYLGRLNEQMGNAKESCEARYKVEYFQPGSETFTRVIEKDIQDIWKNMFGLLRRKLRGKKIDIKKDVILTIITKGYMDVSGDVAEKREALDAFRAFAVLEALHRQALLKNIPRKNIEYDYSGKGQRLPRNRKSGKNRMVDVCIRWDIKPQTP
ncbi:MAG: hypothetical protein H8K07_07730 [Nitrospira sp.]|nr:hypothetical protein [Nitrospira sp.]